MTTDDRESTPAEAAGRGDSSGAGRVEALTSWHHDWRGVRAVVLGAGAAGFSAADTLAELGAEVTVLADDATEDRADLLEVVGARLVVAGLTADGVSTLAAAAPDLVIASPGFSPAHPVVASALGSGIPVWGDVELAWRVRDKTGSPAEWICVTGTNGKTTTVQLTTAMLAAHGARVVACGNIGLPVLDAVRDPTGFDVLVVELSSFQLHYATSLSPLASVCLNLSGDHLDWYSPSDDAAADYAADKARVYERTRVACVYNRDDDATRTMVEDAEVVEGCRAIGIGLQVPGPSDFGLVEDILCDRAFLDARHSSALEIVTTGELDEVGLGAAHMVSNVLAAAALARAAGASIAAVRTALAAFRLDRHRTELVATGEIAGGQVRFIDDSKATNAGAADASLRAFDTVVWIVGGLLKGTDIAPLIAAHASRVRSAVVIGADRGAVLAAFARHAPDVPVIEVVTTDTEQVMPEAVRSSASAARPGDVVLLAPAAASMDLFRDYADRGRRFAAAVHEMLGDRPDVDQDPRLP